MAYEKQTFIDYPNEGYTTLKAEHLEHIEDGIWALDQALDVKTVDVEKMYYGTNRFDKNKHQFIKNFYQGVNIGEDLKFTKATASTCAGGGWYDIPVEAGKTYTMKIKPITINYDNRDVTYGIFNALFFVDNTGTVITNVHRTKNYYTKINNDYSHPDLAKLKYNTSEVICDSYETSGHTYLGMGTSCVTFTVLDKSIVRVHIQIGSWETSLPSSSGYGNSVNFLLDTEFCKRYLTDDEIQQLQDGFQINEGDTLLEYEEFNDHTYIEQVTESNLTKLQAAFTVTPVPSSNLFDPVNYIINHAYISSTGLSETNPGAPAISTYGRSCLIKIPVDTKSYVLHLNEKITIGNKEFCTFGGYLCLDENDVIICGTYPFTRVSGIEADASKAFVSGTGTSTLTFTIFDPSIKYLMMPVIDSDKNQFGLWQDYENTEGLTKSESLELFSKIQLNDQGYIPLPYESFYNVSYKSVISPEYIQGLDTFIDDTNKKIEEAIANIKVTGVAEPSMSCVVQENDFFIRAKSFEAENDMVWKLQKVNATGGNKYFNISSMNTCSKNVKDEYIPDSLRQWKGCGDDICPPCIHLGYIAANHGAPCVDKVTHTNHGKTAADIGSVYMDTATNKTYVLTHVYDANSIGLVYFDDSIMTSGVTKRGAPAVGATLVCQSQGTNTGNIIVEQRADTQLWPCFNHYTIKFFVDGVEQDLNEITVWEGNRFEVVTQYDVIFVPAMLQYLMDNVGNVTELNPESIQENYMTMYINYQFNRNGSISTYSSFYFPIDVRLDYIGLVQSSQVSTTPFTYIPDTTTYITPVQHDLATTITFPKSIWASQNKVPYRYYQFADSTFGKGMSQVYDTTVGWGKPDIRLQHSSTAGRYSGSAKMYSAFVSGCTIAAGTYFDGLAARVPLYKYDTDLTSMGWYWCGDDIIMMIDVHQSINKDIVLPTYMNNKRIEVLDKTDSCDFNQTYVFNNKLRFISSGYGYLVIRLYS